MATYDFTDSAQSYFAGGQVATDEDNRLVAHRAIVDFAKQNLSASDVATVLDIPADVFIVAGFARVITADASVTMTYGYGASVNEFVASATAFATAGTVLGKWLSVPDHVSSATTVQMAAGAAADTLKAEFLVFTLKGLDSH